MKEGIISGASVPLDIDSVVIGVETTCEVLFGVTTDCTVGGSNGQGTKVRYEVPCVISGLYVSVEQVDSVQDLGSLLGGGLRGFNVSQLMRTGCCEKKG